jgi:hypothetical protein
MSMMSLNAAPYAVPVGYVGDEGKSCACGDATRTTPCIFVSLNLEARPKKDRTRQGTSKKAKGPVNEEQTSERPPICHKRKICQAERLGGLHPHEGVSPSKNKSLLDADVATLIGLVNN